MGIEAQPRDRVIMQYILTKLAIAIVWVAAAAFFNTIIGVFGIEAALLGLALFIALAIALALRPQRTEHEV